MDNNAMIQEHLDESKRLILDFADKVMLDSEDLKIDKRRFAPLRQKMDNFILSDYLIEIANERISNFEDFINDESIIKDYKENLIQFLRKVIKERT